MASITMWCALELMYTRFMTTMSAVPYSETTEQRHIDLHCSEMLVDDTWRIHATTEWYPWIIEDII